LRILISGANGFLGSHVAERLQEQGHELRLMLRSTSNVDFLNAVHGYERVNADLRDAASLSSVAVGIDTVLHMGGVTLARTEAEYQAANGTGTANLVSAAVAASVRRFVYVSSLAAHGPSPSPQPRPLDAPAAPVTAYGRSKLSGEYAVQARQQHLQTVILRPPAVYGPRDRALLPLYRAGKLGIFPLLGDGMNLASFAYVDDAVDAIVKATISETPPAAVYTFEDGQPHTWRALVDAFSRATGRKIHVIPTPEWLYKAAGYAGGLAGALVRKPLPLSPEKVTHISQRYWVCNSDAITRDLGWQARVGIDEGLVRTLAWCKQHRWL
jgi:nucleoside-diphosphate-sugar epimerase